MEVQFATLRAEIMHYLAKVEDCLLVAECDGRQLAELDCYTDVNEALSTLVQTIDYYVD